MKYRSTSIAQKAFLGILWIGAIVAVFAIVQSYPIAAQQGSQFSLKMASPVLLALVITIFVLISPTGAIQEFKTGNPELDAKDLPPIKPLGTRIKLVCLVLLGMAWASLVAPLLVLVKHGVESLLLRPICAYSAPPRVSAPCTGAHLPLQLQEWWQSSYQPIECRFGDAGLVVGLDKFIGSISELLLKMGSGVSIILLTVVIWGYVTYRLILVFRKFR